MLPEISGLQVLNRVRELLGHSTPVMMLTCMDSESMIVDALSAGADDFLVKPMSAAVLRARLEAHARRLRPVAAPVKALELGPYRLDFQTQSAHVAGERVVLTPKEFDVAWVLMNNPNRFISKAELVATIWGRLDNAAAHTIAQHMHALRKKLRMRNYGARICAVYGQGYRFEVEVREEPVGVDAGRY